MFLDENKYYVSDGITADPSCGYRIILESEQVWNKMEMQMVKLEHTAIINNDYDLLQEGASDFMEKVKSFFKTLGNTFLRYLDKVIAKWQELQMKVMTKITNFPKIYRAILKNKEIADKEVDINMNLVYAGTDISNSGDKFLAELEKAKPKQADEVCNKVTNIIKQYENGGRETKIKLGNQGAVKEVLQFLRSHRSKAIDVLKKARNLGAKLMNEGIKEANARNEELVKTTKEKIDAYKKTINEFIATINKASVQAFKIMRLAASDGATGKDIDEGMKSFNSRPFDGSGDDDDDKKKEDNTKKEWALPYNILDQF